MRIPEWALRGYPYITLSTLGSYFATELTVKVTFEVEDHASVKAAIQKLVDNVVHQVPELALIRCNLEVKSEKAGYFGRIIVQNIGVYPSIATLRILAVLKKKIYAVLIQYRRGVAGVPVSSVV